MAMGQRLIYLSNDGNQSTNCNGTRAGALGQLEQQEAMAMGQWQQSIIAIAIDRSCGCGRVGRGVRAWALYSMCFVRNVSECQMEVRLKE
jgi:hypothetical protein